MSRKILLVCGLLSSLLYVAMNVLVAAQWKAYSSASQTVSELSAIGAPTRPLWVVPAAFYTLLVTAFGVGVWMSANHDGANHDRADRDRVVWHVRALRAAGGFLVLYGALGIVWPFAPMHMRETLAAGGSTVSDTIHLALGGVTVVLMLLAMCCAAVAFGAPFRVYTIISLVILTAFGVLTFADAPRVGANLP